VHRDGNSAIVTARNITQAHRFPESGRRYRHNVARAVLPGGRDGVTQFALFGA
jgi:hypothetical protein